MYIQKLPISRKTFFKLVFAEALKVNEENSRIRNRIRIHTKMSWIRHTGSRRARTATR
jgi:hypothetical protein